MFCFSDDVPAKPIDKPAESVVGMDVVTKFPRTVDTMARMWMLLFKAAQDANVPPTELVVTRNIGFGAGGLWEGSGAWGLSKQVQNCSVITIETNPVHFSAFVRKVSATWGSPTVFLLTNSCYAVYSFPGAWIGTEKMFIPGISRRDQGEQSGDLSRRPLGSTELAGFYLVVATAGDVMTEDIMKLCQEYKHDR